MHGKSILANLIKRCGGLIDRGWQFIGSAQWTVYCLFALMIVALMQIYLPQESPAGVGNTFWLSNFPLGLRQFADRLAPMGIFSIRYSLWLYLPLSMLSFNLMLIIGDTLFEGGEIEIAGDLVIAPFKPYADKYRAVEAESGHDSIINKPKAKILFKRLLLWHYLRSTQRRNTPGQSHLLSGRIASSLLWIGLLLIVIYISLALPNLRNDSILLYPGQWAKSHLADSLQFRLKEIEGTQTQIESQDSLTGRSQEFKRCLGCPFFQQDFVFSPSQARRALRITANAHETLLPLLRFAAGAEPVLELYLPVEDTLKELTFAIPERNLTFEISRQTEQLTLMAYRGVAVDAYLVMPIPDEGVLNVEDINFQIEKIEALELRESLMPGWWLILSGSILMLLGTITSRGIPSNQKIFAKANG